MSLLDVVIGAGCGGGVDEEAGEDEVDDVEEAASLHVNGERHVRVGVVTARVDTLVTRYSHRVHVPLLVLSHRRDRVINNAIVGSRLRPQPAMSNCCSLSLSKTCRSESMYKLRL